ncbi:VWA domain-containing protein [Methylotenera sp.]|uniref:VWA domain-containing protein n=1 Tax=Methylotenera sp. TaxID=2051956 RepID=UPI002ED84565
MHPIYNYLRHRKDVGLLLAAFLLLVIALFNPKIPIKRNIYSYLFAVDISQSMNVVDKTLNGKPVSRLVYTQDTLHKLVSELPCGTNISIGLFAGVSVAALYTPIEVCENFDAINDTIDHFDWRNGWSGNSRIRASMPVLAKTIRSFPAPAQVVFFTDGEEAPKLHIFNRQDLTSFQGGDDWLLVGVGSDKGTPIPKFDEFNQLIGYWANESFAMQPGIAQISESNLGTRNDSVANGEGDRYLSKLDEAYLKDLAKEINGMYVRADSVNTILSAMKKQKPARRDNANFEIRWVLASLAGILFIFAYLPKHPLHELKTQWRTLVSRRREVKQETL